MNQDFTSLWCRDIGLSNRKLCAPYICWIRPTFNHQPMKFKLKREIMRKLHYILAGLVLVFALVSCEKNNKHDLDVDAMKAAKAKKAVVELGANIPESDGGVVPEVIPGENKGGNRTCDEVYAVLGQLDDVYLCGNKVDWDDDAEGFASSFPDGLNVTVTGIHVGFTIDGCVEINGGFYKVGAVIVKGSNAANVYFYPGGTTADFGLAAPGDKHMVSNLTFCFVPCEVEEVELVVALKAFVNPKSGVEDVIYSTGTALPNMKSVEYAPYTVGGGLQTIILKSELSGLEAGTMTIDVENDPVDGLDYFVVNINADDSSWSFGDHGCYFYIGSLSGLLPLNTAGDFPYNNYTPPENRSFKIPVSEVIPVP